MDNRWRRRSACEATPGPFAAALDDDDGDSAAVAEARQICASCPVTIRCYEASFGYRLADGEPVDTHVALPGVWGGLTRPERQEIHDAHAVCAWCGEPSPGWVLHGPCRRLRKQRQNRDRRRREADAIPRSCPSCDTALNREARKCYVCGAATSRMTS